MNLDTQDLELIKVTVRAAVAEATADLVTKSELKEFRTEVNAKWDSTYSREVIDLKFSEANSEYTRLLRDKSQDHERLWAAIKVNEAAIDSSLDVTGHLLENAWVKIGLFASGIIQVATVWQIFFRPFH